ncbi:MAG: L-threonylcarbamoyladenylate synthase [Bacteroidota bacterium]
MALHMKVNPQDPEDRVLVLAAEVLQAGGIVVYPTETLYGIGANAWNAQAVRKVRALKGRGQDKPILVVVHDLDMVRGLTTEISLEAQVLMRALWPGPLTLVFPAAHDVPVELTAGTGTIGIRIPSSAMSVSLARFCGYPLTSTSANPSGDTSHSTIAQIEAALGPGVDLYLDAGLLPPSPPSTVVDVSVSPPRLLREGAVPKERVITLVPSLQR